MKEFTAVSTPDELIICIEIDGKITKSYERRRISDDEVEVIQHRNRDRLGNYYTTRHIYRISEGAVVNSDSHHPNISPVISGYKQPSKSAQSIEITGFIEKSKPPEIIFFYTLLPLTA